MPPVEAPVNTNEIQNDSDSIAKPMVGIIYPPPEVRNIVDKTASFVARNGPSFEDRIRANEVNNPKFNFLTSTDPYHAYYQHKVKEFSEGKGETGPAPVPSFRPSAIPRTTGGPEAVKAQVDQIVLKDPPPEPEFINEPPSISAFDIDVVKLTAQFVARNGRQFLTTLMNKEQRNYQFDFLRPQHSMFNYFTKLVEQYTKVMIPPKDLMAKLKKDSDDPKEILKQVNYRVQWAKHQEQERKREEDAKEKERIAYAQIDWHDFVVVETVDYQPNEAGLFPTPTTPEEVGARILMQERIDEVEAEKAPTKSDRVLPVSEEPDDVEMELSDKEDEDMADDLDGEAEMPPPSRPPIASSQPPLLPAMSDSLVIRQYDPKQTRAPVTTTPVTDQYLISPLTQEKIPANRLQEHMKISLLDPKWREQKERQIREKKEAESNYDADINIEANLRRIAERRTDIFGIGVEEAEIGKKIGEEDLGQAEEAVWDGHTASVSRVSQKARENISIEEQIKVLHQHKGLVEDESKMKIGPSVTKVPVAAPPPVSSVPASVAPMTTLPKPPLMQQPGPPLTTGLALGQPVGVSAPQPVPAPSQAALRLQPQGVPAPGASMILPPGMMMSAARAPQGILPPLGVALGAPLGPPIQPVAQPIFRPVIPQVPVPANPPPVAPMALADDEPPSKKAKNEESLIPEDHWIAQRPGPVVVLVQVPSVPDKAEWNLNGQTLTFTLSPKETCGALKNKITEALGMPAAKQKLQYEGMFIKDSNSLAFYNFMPECVVQLSTKERGGRKK